MDYHPNFTKTDTLLIISRFSDISVLLINIKTAIGNVSRGVTNLQVSPLPPPKKKVDPAFDPLESSTIFNGHTYFVGLIASIGVLKE